MNEFAKCVCRCMPLALHSVAKHCSISNAHSNTSGAHTCAFTSRLGVRRLPSRLDVFGEVIGVVRASAWRPLCASSLSSPHTPASSALITLLCGSSRVLPLLLLLLLLSLGRPRLQTRLEVFIGWQPIALFGSFPSGTEIMRLNSRKNTLTHLR